MIHWACRCLIAIPLIMVSGCAQWLQKEEVSSGPTTTQLPNSTLSPESVVMQISVLRVPTDMQAETPAIWEQVDEQHLGTDLRRRLRQNGIRAGVVGSQLPDQLRQIIDREQEKEAEGAATEEGLRKTATGTWHERKQTRAGRRYKIVLTEARPRIAAMIRINDSVRGNTRENAHCEFALRTQPQRDGSVRVELTPEVYYGQPKQTYTPGSFGFVYETKQERVEFEALKIGAVLAPGQTLLVAATPELVGLGQHLFSDPANPQQPQKVVLVRLAQTQIDDLFDPGQIVAPVVTPTE